MSEYRICGRGVSSSHRQRVLGLDLLRIILCVGVLLYHYMAVIPSSGPYSVNAFFVMSGFLLAAEFERTETLDVCRFYAKKAKRLLPVFAFAMAVGFLYILAKHVDDGDPLFPAFKAGGSFHFSMDDLLKCYNPPAWYMGCEFFMLALAPLFFSLYRKHGAVAALTLVAALGAAGLHLLQGGSISSLYCHGLAYNDLYFSPWCRLWQFTAGILSFQLLFRRLPSVSAWGKALAWGLLLLAALLMLLLLCLKERRDLHYWNFTFVFDVLCVLFFGLLIPLLYRYSRAEDSALLRTVSYLASLSYPVYLLHVPLLKWSGPLFFALHLPSPFRLTGSALLTLLLSAALLKVIALVSARFSRRVS